MANHASAKKRIRQTKRRATVNRGRLGLLRTSIKKVEAAIAAGSRAEAEAAFKAAQPDMMRGAQKGIAHRNMVARKLSRLSKRIKAMAA